MGFIAFLIKQFSLLQPILIILKRKFQTEVRLKVFLFLSYLLNLKGFESEFENYKRLLYGLTETLNAVYVFDTVDSHTTNFNVFDKLSRKRN